MQTGIKAGAHTMQTKIKTHKKKCEKNVKKIIQKNVICEITK
jgi:hypothetical protein